MQTAYLVTGGAGFIGSHIVQALCAEGERVRVVDNLSSGRRANLEGVDGRVEFIEGDIGDEELLRDAVRGVRCIFHLAALASVVGSIEDPAATHRTNCTGTLNLLLAARDAGVERLVFSSSSSVYGDTHLLPTDESVLPAPLSPYALSKLTGEHYARIFHELYGLKTFSLRYFNVFGPRQDPASDYAAVIPLFIDALLAGRPLTIYGDGGQTRDFTYVEDVVAANLACRRAPESAAGGVYNVARGDRVSVNDLARHLGLVTGQAVEPRHVEARAGEIRDSQADATRAREALGWVPKVDLDEGLRRTVVWFTATRARHV